MDWLWVLIILNRTLQEINKDRTQLCKQDDRINQFTSTQPGTIQIVLLHEQNAV